MSDTRDAILTLADDLRAAFYAELQGAKLSYEEADIVLRSTETLATVALHAPSAGPETFAELTFRANLAKASLASVAAAKLQQAAGAAERLNKKLADAALAFVTKAVTAAIVAAV